jgi:ABC-type dipeptide/oligopeptide/nickel transport system permease subunit
MILLAPAFAPYDPMQAVNGAERQLPTLAHVLGTDLLGRDVLSRLLTGGSNTLAMSLLASFISIVFGVGFGLALGWFGGWLDALGSIVLDAFLAFPGLLAAFVAIALLGSGQVQIAIAVGVGGIAPFARMVRNAVQGGKTQPYVLAAMSLGASDWRMMRHHVLPNIAAQVAAFAGVTFSWALLNGAALAFLGFAGDPGVSEWGTMLAEGRQLLRVQPVLALAAGGALTFTVWMVNRVAAL